MEGSPRSRDVVGELYSPSRLGCGLDVIFLNVLEQTLSHRLTQTREIQGVYDKFPDFFFCIGI